MFRNIFHKIGYKLIFAVGITTLLIISVFAYFNIRTNSSALLEEVENHANQLSETVKYSVHYDMMLNQRERIHKIINTIGEQESIREVRILNKVGEIIYSSHENDIGRMVDKKAESCYACHAADQPLEKLSITQRTRIFRLHPDSSRVLGIINPIYNEESCWAADCHAHSKDQTVLGVLDVTMSLDDVDKSIQTIEIEIAIFALIAIAAISFIIGMLVRKMIDTPVRELVDATKQVASGDLNYSIKDKGNDELGLLARSFNNMTKKLSEARMQLFQSDKLASLGRLAAGVAHEINNPLTGVLTYSSFLLKRTQDNPEIQEDLKVIVRETKRSREIVKSLLDFARQSVPKKNAADLNEIINQSITVVESQLTLNNVKIEKHLDAELPRITVDSNQMQQVFINLVVNASDAIGKNGGTVTISTTLLKRSPVGITQIKKASCPKRHDLTDNEIKIDGLPSIKIKAKSNNSEGFIYLDPVYGKNRHQYDVSLELKKEIQMMCPQCNTSLTDETKKCPDCGAPVFYLEVPQHGRYEGCSRRGCNWQRWEAVDQSGQKEYAEIKIKDTGCGIPKDELPRIFEPFFSTKGQKGTGLGLAVIWGIIDNHDGSISVESEQGKGTVFTVILPVSK
ncbi:MAG: HAMP domain-containing protein [Ignavibacteriales bacterium]|nr:MAG: HAMP domain-containing protein [Ignavibacteriales bacterium]